MTLKQASGAEVAIPTPLTEVTSQARLSPFQGSSSCAESRVRILQEKCHCIVPGPVSATGTTPTHVSGEGDEVKGIFTKWHEQLQVVASMCQ